MLHPFIPAKKKTSLKAEVFGTKGWPFFWEARFLPRWIPIFMGLGLGLVVAYLITDGHWHYAVPLVFAVPAAIVFNRYPFVAILMWILVVPFFLNAQNSADRFIFWMFHRGLIPGSLLVVILSDWLKTNNRPLGKIGRAELAALIFISFTILNIFLFAPNVRRTLIQFYDLIFVPVTMYWLIRLINPTADDLKRLMWVALFIVMFQSILGMLSWFSPASVPEQWRSRVEGERTVGTLKNVAVYTSTLLLFSLLLLQYGVTHRSGWIRYGSLVMFGLAEFCVFLSFSRASWVGGIAVIVAALILYPKVVSRLVIVGALLAYIFAGALLADELRFAVERLSGDEALNSAESRVITNNASILMFQEKPTLGWGFKNYDRYDRQFQVRVGDLAVTNDGTSHNTYLSILVELGLVGLIFYLIPMFWWLFLTVRHWGELPQFGFWSRSLVLSLWVVMMHMFIVTNSMDMIRHHEFGTTLWWLTLGLIGNILAPYFTTEQTGPTRLRPTPT